MTVSVDEAIHATMPARVARDAGLSVPQSQRIHYFDNLRALAMLLGVFLHAGLAYARPAQSIWLATDPNSSVIVDAGIWFIHLFRMGLFFLLSGYFAKLVVARKGLRAFLWSRCTRIVAPFVLFYPFLLAAMTVVFVFALSYLDEPRGLMGLIATAAKESVPADRQPYTTMHLWFLYYLFVFSMLGALLSRLSWIRLDGLFRRPQLLWLCPLALAPAVFVAGIPLPAPESFIPQWWPIAFYGAFFLAGWQLYGREALLDRLRPYVWHFTVGCLVLFVPYYLLMPVLDLSELVKGGKPASDWRLTIEAVLTAYLAVLLTIASLLLGQRYLAKKISWLGFIADSSYWVYLIHLPIVIFLQTLLVPTPWPLWLKFLAVLAGTTIPCLVTYLVFVRYTPLGWLLHGKRAFP